MTRQRLIDALTALDYALDPWFGHLGLTVPADPADPFGATVRLPGPLFHETPAQGDARRAAAVARFKAGLDRDRGMDAHRVRAMITDAEQSATTSGPRYATVVADALARLAADAEGIPAGATTAWCPECGRRRAVHDVDPAASTYDGPHEMGYTVTYLACGHTVATTPVVVGPSPGGESAAEAQAQAVTYARMIRTHALADAHGDR